MYILHPENKTAEEPCRTERQGFFVCLPPQKRQKESSEKQTESSKNKRTNMNYLVDKNGYYGEFGGAYVPEILHKCVEELQNNYLRVLQSENFKQEYDRLLRDYVGRPSPLYLAPRLSEKYGCKIYLKREDLNHTGAHKINNSIGQVLLARRMGKHRIIASWVVDTERFPETLVVTATSPEGHIMALKHREYDIRGIQFHPESVLTPDGKTIVRNWLLH